MQALTIEKLNKIAPSIFTKSSAERTTEKYPSTLFKTDPLILKKTDPPCAQLF